MARPCCWHSGLCVTTSGRCSGDRGRHADATEDQLISAVDELTILVNVQVLIAIVAQLVDAISDG